MRNVNKHLDANVMGLTSPLIYEQDYGASGMVQQLIDLVSLEATQPGVQFRLFLDEMSPVGRDTLYLMLRDLRDAMGEFDPALIENPGPFSATTGWALGGDESANAALSAANDELVATLTSGTESALIVSTTATTVIGVTYRVTITNAALLADAELAAATSADLSDSIASTILDSSETISSASLLFEAEGTTTHVGLYFPATPADGAVMALGSLNIKPVVPAP